MNKDEKDLGAALLPADPSATVETEPLPKITEVPFTAEDISNQINGPDVAETEPRPIMTPKAAEFIAVSFKARIAEMSRAANASPTYEGDYAPAVRYYAAAMDAARAVLQRRLDDLKVGCASVSNVEGRREEQDQGAGLAAVGNDTGTSPTETASALTVWRGEPYCPICGSAICEHPERERTPNRDVPDALRNELLRVAADRHMSWYYLCAIYRQGVTDATSKANSWQPIETHPERRTVLVFYRNELGKGRTMRGCFYPPGTLDMGDNEGEADDNGMNAEGGWYEESDAYEYLMPLNGTPTHWMPLPSPPLAASSPSTEVSSTPAASSALKTIKDSSHE